MKNILCTAILLVTLLLTSFGCALDKAATLKNLQMTEKETRENDIFWDNSNAVDSVKNAAKIRNAEHRKLAEEMARAAKNSEDDISKAKLDQSDTPATDGE